MKNEILINTIRTRPRFKVVSGMSAQGFSDKVNLHLKNRSRVLSGYCNTEVGRISMIQDQDKYWAPQLELRIEKNPDNPSQIEIRGIFVPRNSVWTLFMFSYGLGGAILLTTCLY